MENKDRPAFPVTKDMGYSDAGLTKLEEFTKSAMQGILSNPVLMEGIHKASKDGISTLDRVAVLARGYAHETLNKLKEQ